MSFPQTAAPGRVPILVPIPTLIPQAFILSLLARVDIVEVVGRYVPLKRDGANFAGLCPFHDERTPSFKVSPTRQFYHCFGCGAHDNAIGFLMEFLGHSFREAVESLAAGVGMAPPQGSSSVLPERDARRHQEAAQRAQELRKARARAEESRRDSAAAKASAIVNSCALASHPYLVRKGFPSELGLVDDAGHLVVPMRSNADYRRIQSVQFIDGDGGKKFLFGGAAAGAVHFLGNGPETWLCEGYATGLSVRAALASLYRRARVCVAFSAVNLGHVARELKGRRFVVADNDASGTGERVARESGLPWCMPPDVETDANDLHAARGVRAVAELMRQIL